MTNVERLVETTSVREKLGIELVRGELVSLYPAKELAKALTPIIEDLKMGKITVPDLYHADDRRKYVDSLPRASRPKTSTRLATPVLVDDLTTGTKKPRTVSPTRTRSQRPPRTTVIPKTAQLDVTLPRINQVYNELATLNAEQFPNACSVLLSVFIELSVDYYIRVHRTCGDGRLPRREVNARGSVRRARIRAGPLAVSRGPLRPLSPLPPASRLT